MDPDAEAGRRFLAQHLDAFSKCQVLICASPHRFLFENENSNRKRTGNILVQLLSDGTREQYQKAARVIYYNERPFSDIMRSDTPMNIANRWSFDAKIDFVAYLTAATRSVISELRDELLKADPSLRDSIETALAPISGEPDPDNDHVAFRAFLAEKWKRNFFGFRTERTDTMNRYVVAYALLWKAIIGDVARVLTSASRILTKIANEVVLVLFDEYANNPLLNPPFDLSGDQPTVTSRLLLELRRVCIAVHNSACRLNDVMGRYKGIFRANPDTNIVPPFIEVDENEAELRKREFAIRLREERDVLTDQLFTNTRKFCIILDSKPFRQVEPNIPKEGSEKAAISAIQNRLISLSRSETMQFLISDVNMPFGLGLSGVDEMNSKYPLPGKRSLKLPVVLWLRHVFYGELLDNRNTEYERTTAFIRFSTTVQESPYAVYIDDYLSSAGGINVLAETLRVSKLKESQKQQVLEFGAMQIALDGIQGVLGGPDVTTEQREIAASLTPFTYLELDAFIGKCESLFADDPARLTLVNVAREASDEIQDFIRVVDIEIDDISKKDPTGYLFGNSDTFSTFVSRCTRKKDRDMLMKRLDAYGLDRYIAKLEALSSRLTSAIADVFVLYVWTMSRTLKEIADNLKGVISSSMSGPPSPRRKEDNDTPDDRVREFQILRKRLSNLEDVWQSSLVKGIGNASNESFLLIDSSGSMSTAVLREKLHADTLAHLAFISKNGDPLFKQLTESPANSVRASQTLTQMKFISNMQNTERGIAVFASSAKIAAENIAFATVSQQWYWQSIAQALFATGMSLAVVASNLIRGAVNSYAVVPQWLMYDPMVLQGELKEISTTFFSAGLKTTLGSLITVLQSVAQTPESQELITLLAVLSAAVLYHFSGTILPYLYKGAGALYTTVSSNESRKNTVLPNIVANGIGSGIVSATGAMVAMATGVALPVVGLVAALGPMAAMLSSYLDFSAKQSQITTVFRLGSVLAGTVASPAIGIRLMLLGAGVLLQQSRFPATVVTKLSGGLLWAFGSDIEVVEGAEPSKTTAMRLRSKEGASLAARSILSPTGIPRSGPTAVLDRVYEDGPGLFTNNLDMYITNAISGLGYHAIYSMGVCGYEFAGTGYGYSLFSTAILAGSLILSNQNRHQTEELILETTGAASYVPQERAPIRDIRGGGKLF